MANGMLITLQRALAPASTKTLMPVDNRGGWWPVLREAWSGAWQHNVQTTLEDGLRYWAVFRCINLIASDISKMRIKLVEQNEATRLWSEVEAPAFSPVLRKPNEWQTRIQFMESWMISKLSRGNTYVLKQRDKRGVVTAMHILDPNRTKPLVAENGMVFYELAQDHLAGVPEGRLMVPWYEIIHDRWNTLYHPLVGLSPLYACALNALAGLKISSNTAMLFANGGRPSGLLTADGAISDATAARAKTYWDENFTGENAGKVAVLGDGLKYETLTMSAVDAQVIDQLKWNDAVICGVFGVPSHMVNVGTAPSYNNVEALVTQYYTQALQVHMEAIELLLDEGLGLHSKVGEGKRYGTEFDLEALLRMDTSTKVRTATEGLKGLWSTNEARATFDMAPVEGGDHVMSQQQNFSLPALAKRDAQDDPFKSAAPPAAEKPDAPDDDEEDDDAADDAEDKALEAFERKMAA